MKAVSPILAALCLLVGVGTGASSAFPHAETAASRLALAETAYLVCNDHRCVRRPSYRGRWYRPYGYYQPYGARPHLGSGFLGLDGY